MRPIDDSPVTRDGKVLVLAYDHGIEHGPVDFDPQPESADPEHVFEVARHPAVTSLAVGKGAAETYYPSYEDDVSLLAKLNGTSNLWMGEPDSAVNCSVEYAAEELGAEAVGFTVYPGTNHEVEMFEEFREVQEQARAYDMPVVMWAYARGQAVKNDTSEDVVAYAARLGFELGADVAKVKYPGSKESMQRVCEMSGPMNVIMSGGSKTTDMEFLKSVEGVIEAGGSGLAVGRNVWQRENPERILDALEKVIYDEVSAEEALEAAPPKA